MKKIGSIGRKYLICGVTATAIAVAACSAGSINRTQKTSDIYGKQEMLAMNETAGNEVVNFESADEEELVSSIVEGIDVSEKDIYKDETVYVFADPSGKSTQTLVNEVLRNKDKATTLTDVTDLREIENIKGDETFTMDGDKVVWQADGNDITYQGKTDKEAPVGVDITYYLDGKEMSPEEICGKSGNVKVRFDYKNTATVQKEINGKTEEVNVPFIAVSGMVLGDNFTNVTVTNGKSVEEGDSQLVIGYAMPGLADSLDVEPSDFDEDVLLPDYFELSADVTDFSLDMTLTVVMDASNMDVSGALDFSEIDDMVAALDDASNQLAEGTGNLAGGIGTLLSKLGEYSAGVNALDKGIDSLASNSGNLANGVTAIDASAKSISEGINTLDEGLKAPMTQEQKDAIIAQVKPAIEAQFAEGTETYNYIYGQASAQFQSAIIGSTDAIYQQMLNSELYSSMLQNATYAYVLQLIQTDPEVSTLEEVDAKYGLANIQAQVAPQVQAALSATASSITNGIAGMGADTIGKSVVSACKDSALTAASQAAVSGAEGTKLNISQQIETVQSSGYSLVTGAQALADGTSSLSEKIPALTDGISKLAAGSDQLIAGTSQIVNGVNELSDGAKTLDDGMNTFNTEAIGKLVTTYNGDIKEFAERIRAVVEASTEYDTFTKLEEGKTGTTKFIIKTEGISSKED